MDGLSSVWLILNASEDAMRQMLDRLEQLSEIRSNEHFRLAFLFQENAQKFIDVFGERRSRMRQFLSELEKTADKLDSMKKGASISTVVGSSVGIVGGGLSIAGIILAPFTAGVSLVCTVAGAVGGVTTATGTLVTDITETAVNRHHERNVQESLKRFMEDMEMIQECKDKAASFKEPYKKHGTNSSMTKHAKGVVNVGKNAVALKKAYSAYKAFQCPVVGSSVVAPQRVTSTLTKVASVAIAGLGIGLDIYSICKEGASLWNGSQTEISQFVRCRVALFKSEMKCWEKICDSLKKGVGKITESQEILDQPFLPAMNSENEIYSNCIFEEDLAPLGSTQSLNWPSPFIIFFFFFFFQLFYFSLLF